jgi:3-deoxy-D-manno-octulosonic-acid transferase
VNARRREPLTGAAGPDPARAPGFSLRTYRVLSPALAAAASLAAPFSAKLREGLRGRHGLDARTEAAAHAVQGCVWFHVTSVGEYEQARPLIAALRERPSPPPLVVTHFSPSGRHYAEKRPCADLHEYLPLDRASAMERLVRLWRPRLLVFVKFDCWPNQVLAATRAGVPVVLMAGSLRPDSARLHPFARPLYRDLFNRFAHLGVCTEEDRRRFVDDLGVRCPVTVTGDTRAEQVILRWEAAGSGATAAALRRLGGRLLILGSTWPPDEKLWLPALGRLLADHPDVRVVLTPHEPSPARLAQLERALASHGLRTRRLSAVIADDTTAATANRAQPHGADVILTDSIGQLAEIYRAGHLAYVGGGFTTGVHNTMEPAVAGLPVLFGPVIDNAEEAGELVRRGAGQVVRTPEQALAAAGRLLGDPAALALAAEAARAVVLAQRGATTRSLAVLEPLLSAP